MDSVVFSNVFGITLSHHKGWKLHKIMFAESYLRFLGQKCVAKIDFLKFFCQIEAWYVSSFLNKVAVVWKLDYFFLGGGGGRGGSCLGCFGPKLL